MEATQTTQMATQTAAKEQGRVRWFEPHLGYGFIERQDHTEIFVHFSSIVMQGFKTLNDAVEFEVKDGPKGLYAASVRRLG